MSEKFTRRKLTALIFPALIALLTIWVFAKPLFSNETLWSMDNAPIYPHDHQDMSVEAMTGAWKSAALGESVAALPLHHSRILAAVLPPFVFRVASYIVNVLLLIFAGYYLLRGRGFSGLAAILPAIALAYSGYMFTLISAGHIGMFDMYPYAVLAFGLIDRAITRRSLWHFAAAGACVGIGIGAQPDVQFLFGFLLAIYAVYLLVTHFPRKNVGKGLITLLIGATLGGVFFVGTSLTLFRNLYDVYIPERNAMRGDTTESKWVYSTNWSLPPEDVLEFISPNVRGRETTDRESPYWGRLGQGIDWTPTNKQGFMNFRQHNVYLGAIQVLFAFYALICLFRKKDRAELKKDRTRRDTIFWLAAFLGTVLFAFGRYTPFYKLFWILPGAGRIRCPVKFIHLTELVVAVLFATGLAFFLRDLHRNYKASESKRLKNPLFQFGIGSAVIGLLFLIAIPLTAGGTDLKIHWQLIGYGQIASTLEANMASALMHSAVLFFIGAIVFFLASECAGAFWCKPTVCTIITATVLLDLGVTTRPFVRVKDISPIYAQNHIAEMIVKESDATPARASYLLSPRQKMEPLYTSFMINGVDIVDLRQYTPPGEDEMAFFQAFAQNPVRLWQLTNTRFIIGHVQQLAQLIANPAFEARAYFIAETNGKVSPSDQANGKQVLVEYTGALPRAQVLHDWDVLEPDAALKRMTDPSWNPSLTALVSGDLPPRESTRTASPVTFTTYSRKKIEMKTQAEEEGLLVISDRYDPNWTAEVNGAAAEIVRTNHIMRGVKIPAGEATVTMIFAPYKKQFVISVLFTLALIAWGMVAHLPRKPKTHSSTENLKPIEA